MGRLLLILALLALPLPGAAGGMILLAGHGGPVKGVAVMPDGRVLTASFDYAVGVWTDGAPRWLEGHRAAVNAVLPLATGRVASAGDDFDIRIWRLDTGESRVLDGHEGKVIALARDPATGRLASAGWDGRVGLWPAGGGAGRLLEGHTGAVNDVLFGADGALYSASADGTVRVWDAATGRLRRTLVDHGFGVNRLAKGPGDAWLAYGAVDGGTRVIDPSSGAQIADFTLDRRPILALAASPDGGWLAVGDGEGWIMVVDTAGWRVARDFRAAVRGPVWALAFAPDGQRLYAAGISDYVVGWPLDGLDGATPALGQGERSFLRDPDAMSNGERQFQRKCSVCHTLGRDGARRAGPPLAGLFGRGAGAVSGYPYSRAMRETEITWTRASIDDLFARGPEHVVPGSKMPMQRIASPRDRADLLDYLEDATRN